MSSSADPRYRQIHLDFHTSPHIPDVGAAFDAAAFARTLREARVDSVTLFAKCHHGHLYYETAHAARHPTLRRNLLEEQVAALKAEGIRTPIYLSAQVDEFAANTHPEWVAVNPDGTRVGRGPLSSDFFTWQILDMSSPYLDYLCDQIVDVMEKLGPVDALFFDMCWDQPSVSVWAREAMRQAGLNPENEVDRGTHARRVSQGYQERIAALANKLQKDVPLWFNSRPLVRLREEKKLLHHLEVEALPTGQWGYTYFPVSARFVRTLGLPMLGMTGRFHKSWADFGGLRTPGSLLYDCAQALAHGGGCSVGDQMHPAGFLDEGAYDVIGQVYRHVEQCEPWSRNLKTAAEIAVLFIEDDKKNHANATKEGVYRALTPLGYQYDFVHAEDAWENYPLVIAPAYLAKDEALTKRLDAYLAKGGKVLREVETGEASPYKQTYLRFAEGAAGALPASDHVFYERGCRLEPQAGDEVLARVIEPYFERTWEHFCSHAQTPNQPEASPYAAALVRGGNQALLALPVFYAYGQHGNIPCRQLIAAALERLLPDRLLKITAPSYVEPVLSTRGKETILHLLSFIPQKRTPTLEVVEEAIPARNVALDIAVSGTVQSVRRQPAGADVPFTQQDGRVAFTLDWLEGHEIVVIETA